MAKESSKRGIDGTGYQAPENHRPGAKNCGFFGSPTTLNLCSMCYSDFDLKESSIKFAVEKPLNLIKELNQASPLWDAVVTIIPSSSSLLPSSSSADTSPATASMHRNKANGCFGCKKRVELMGFKCRCGNMFCTSHRLPEQHAPLISKLTAG